MPPKSSSRPTSRRPARAGYVSAEPASSNRATWQTPLKHRLYLTTVTMVVSVVAMALFLGVGEDVAELRREYYTSEMGLAGDSHKFHSTGLLIAAACIHFLVFGLSFYEARTFDHGVWSNFIMWTGIGIGDSALAVAVATNSGIREAGLLLLIMALPLCAAFYSLRAGHFIPSEYAAADHGVYKYAVHFPSFAFSAAPWVAIVACAFEFNRDWWKNDALAPDSDGKAYDDEQRRLIVASTTFAGFAMIARAFAVSVGSIATHGDDGTKGDATTQPEDTVDSFHAKGKRHGQFTTVLWLGALVSVATIWGLHDDWNIYLPGTWHVGDKSDPAYSCRPFVAFGFLLTASLVGFLTALAHSVDIVKGLFESAMIQIIRTDGNVTRAFFESSINALIYVVIVASVGANGAFEMFLGGVAIVAFSVLLNILPKLSPLREDKTEDPFYGMTLISYCLLGAAAVVVPFYVPWQKMESLADNSLLVEQAGNGKGFIQDDQMEGRYGIFWAFVVFSVSSVLYTFFAKSGDYSLRAKLDRGRQVFSSVGQVAIILAIVFGNILDTSQQAKDICSFANCVRLSGGDPEPCIAAA